MIAVAINVLMIFFKLKRKEKNNVIVPYKRFCVLIFSFSWYDYYCTNHQCPRIIQRGVDISIFQRFTHSLFIHQDTTRTCNDNRLHCGYTHRSDNY